MNRRFIAIAIGTLVTLALIVSAVALTLYFPYQQAKARAQLQLSEALQAHAHLLLRLTELETSADLTERDENDGTLLPLFAAQSLLQDFPTSMEFSIGRVEAGRPLLMLRSLNGQVDNRRVQLESDGPFAPFMQRALAGRTGVDQGEDANGRKVLAAYRWIPELGLGLTARIPVEEIRLPYRQAVLVNSLAWSLVALLIGLGFRAAVVPIRRRLDIRESQYRAMFDSAQDGIVIVDSSGAIRSANPAANAMLGHRGRDLVGRPVGQICRESGAGDEPIGIASLRAMADPSASGTAREILARRKDGTTLPCSLRISHFEVEGERLLMAMMRDVSEQKRAARALLEAKEQAEAATRAKSQFLANMSHEIRSPMTGISGMLELLRAGPLEESQREYVELAQDSATALLNIINDILDLSKIESDHLALERTVLNPAHVVQQVVRLFQPRAERKKIALELGIGPEVDVSVVGDPLRLRQVLTNLLDNAVKFTREGRVEVRLERTDVTAGKVGLRFTVIDTGCGMSREQQQNLFSPYMQAELSTARLHGGTGLGLSITRRIVELMGGEIGVESAPGEGATFWFTVALDEADGLAATSGKTGLRRARYPAGSPQTGERRPRATEADTLTAPRVLVADDQNVNRILCREMLAALGAEVVMASDGQQALDLLDRDNFDLVLMDCQMPVLDGYSATRKIRERERAEGRARIPVIALTAHAMSGAREDCLASGMDDHLAKPFRLSQLRAMLQAWLPGEYESA